MLKFVRSMTYSTKNFKITFIIVKDINKIKKKYLINIFIYKNINNK